MSHILLLTFCNSRNFIVFFFREILAEIRMPHNCKSIFIEWIWMNFSYRNCVNMLMDGLFMGRFYSSEFVFNGCFREFRRYNFEKKKMKEMKSHSVGQDRYLCHYVFNREFVNTQTTALAKELQIKCTGHRYIGMKSWNLELGPIW